MNGTDGKEILVLCYWVCVRARNGEEEEKDWAKLPNQQEEKLREWELNRNRRERERSDQSEVRKGGKEERREVRSVRSRTKTGWENPRPAGFFIHVRRNFIIFPVSYFKPTRGKPSMILPLPITSQKSRNLALKSSKTVRCVFRGCVCNSSNLETFSFNY